LLSEQQAAYKRAKQLVAEQLRSSLQKSRRALLKAAAKQLTKEPQSWNGACGMKAQGSCEAAWFIGRDHRGKLGIEAKRSYIFPWNSGFFAQLFSAC